MYTKVPLLGPLSRPTQNDIYSEKVAIPNYSELFRYQIREVVTVDQSYYSMVFYLKLYLTMQCFSLKSTHFHFRSINPEIECPEKMIVLYHCVVLADSSI